MLRIGLGYDFHALESGKTLILGGIVLPFDKGEKGHSDGDALLHAVTDALLGAAGLSDIGELFPPSDDQWKGADSGTLLQKAWKLITDKGWILENIDCVIAIEKPKILPYRQQICSNIAKLLSCGKDQIFIKAKTGEKLGEIGREEAVCVWAVCLLSKN